MNGRPLSGITGLTYVPPNVQQQQQDELVLHKVVKPASAVLVVSLYVLALAAAWLATAAATYATCWLLRAAWRLLSG